MYYKRQYGITQPNRFAERLLYVTKVNVMLNKFSQDATIHTLRIYLLTA